MYSLKKISTSEMKEMVRNVLPPLLKISKNRNDDRIIIKLPMYCCPLVQTIKDVCPEVRHIFNTRHPRDSTSSLAKAFELFEKGLYWRYEGKHFWYYTIALPYTEKV